MSSCTHNLTANIPPSSHRNVTINNALKYFFYPLMMEILTNGKYFTCLIKRFIINVITKISKVLYNLKGWIHTA